MKRLFFQLEIDSWAEQDGPYSTQSVHHSSISWRTGVAALITDRSNGLCQPPLKPKNLRLLCEGQEAPLEVYVSVCWSLVVVSSCVFSVPFPDFRYPAPELHHQPQQHRRVGPTCEGRCQSI